MRTSELRFPNPAPFYKGYIDVLDEVELMDMLQRQLKNFPKFIESVPDNRLNFAYANKKWTIAQVLMHVLDAERVFQYRALRFSRGDRTPLPGFDQDLFAAGLNAQRRSKESMIEEYKNIRRSSIALFNDLDAKKLAQTGVASGLEWSVAKLGFVICGHQKHHRNIIRERYL